MQGQGDSSSGTTQTADSAQQAASAPPPALEVLAGHPYAAFLPGVQKPGRYLGGEEQARIKEDQSSLACRMVLAFPDLYEIGMSHLGTRILYDLVNAQDDLVCERAFSPWMDMERELRSRGLPLVSLETYRPLADFDVVGVSLQYELSYSNVLLNLDLGGVPLRSGERGDGDPIVLAGGPTATHPEPLAPFVDCFLVGEAEEILPDLLRTIGRLRREGRTRLEVLAAVAAVPGMYVPEFYEVAVDERTGLQVVTGLSEAGREAGAPARVGRVFVRDLDAFPFPTRFPVPYAEAVFDRASVEITRGCTEGCRFCQAGMIYRPVRERKPEDIVKAVLDGTDAGGFDSTSLTALSTADVSCIDPLIKTLVPELARRKVKLGIASLRAYGLNEELIDEVKKVGIDGLTFAPEAGTQRMRDVINKNVSDEDILGAARRIFERGYERMKMYFMMGLPTETDEDVAGIVATGAAARDVAREVGNRRAQVTVSVSQLVPKPHTPFQWAALDSMEDLESKVRMLRDLARRAKIGLKTHSVRESWLECLFARGDRRMGEVLGRAYAAGARFDGWREAFDFDRWLDALEAEGVAPEVYTRTLPVDARLPWDHIDVGLEEGFLAGEYRKSLASRLSPPCGKPLGAKVHHTRVEDAEAESRRLVCYDCGVACDLTEMREERIVGLRALSRLTEAREAEGDEIEAPSPELGASELIPADRLRGRLSRSKLADDNAYKHNAEAPYSKLRLFFAKRGTLRFLSHLDLIRLLPRMFRRAGVEMGFSRGYKAKPRLSFGPALALGVAADAEVADVDVLLDRSAEDLAGGLDPAERAAIAAELLERLRPHAPPGMVLSSARIVAPGEKRLGELVAGADYAAALTPEQAASARAGVAAALAATELWVEREDRKAAKRRRGSGEARADAQQVRRLDVRPVLVDARVERVVLEGVEVDALRFRVRSDLAGATARPREVVELLLGEAIPDYLLRREALLARDPEGALVPLDGLGSIWRTASRLQGDPGAVRAAAASLG